MNLFQTLLEIYDEDLGANIHVLDIDGNRIVKSHAFNHFTDYDLIVELQDMPVVNVKLKNRVYNVQVAASIDQIVWLFENDVI